MQHNLTNINKSQVQLSITVTAEEYQPLLEKAATRLSQRTAVKGFRKGKTPYEILKKEVGEMNILQEALESIVQKYYFEAITSEKLDVVGNPTIDIEKMAPGNDVVFKAKVALLPKVSLPDFSKISVSKKEPQATKDKINGTLRELQNINATETLKDGAALTTDKVTIDMDMFMDKVPVDGGQAKDYQVYLGEDHYIPGFNKELEGVKAGDEKTFTLAFPKTHYQKHLAGNDVDFKIKVKGVFERQLPELNDEFAKKLNVETLEELTTLIEKNILAEETQKIEQQTEVEILDTLIEKTDFEEIPDVIIESEKHKILYELKRDLEKNGVTIDQYLQDIKKTEKELFDQFTEQASKRAKAALISRQIAKDQALYPTQEEIDAEMELLKKAYEHNLEAQENLKRPEVRDSVATMVQNRKVMVWLKEKVLTQKTSDKKQKK